MILGFGDIDVVFFSISSDMLNDVYIVNNRRALPSLSCIDYLTTVSEQYFKTDPHTNAFKPTHF